MINIIINNPIITIYNTYLITLSELYKKFLILILYPIITFIYYCNDCLINNSIKYFFNLLLLLLIFPIINHILYNKE